MTEPLSPLEGDELDLRLVDDEDEEDDTVGMSPEEIDDFMSTPIPPMDEGQ